MKKTILVFSIVIIFFVVGLLSTVLLFSGGSNIKINKTEVPAVCTLEARVCPGGSTVGRIGPMCDFATCPEIPTGNAPVSTTSTSSNSLIVANTESQSIPDSKFSDVGINNTFTKDNISITPLKVVEDSRCKLGVMCIQAGTVKLKVKLQSSEISNELILTSGQAADFADRLVTLVVDPLARENETLEDKNYMFNFTITNQNKTLDATGTLSGSMTIGPLCPVETINNPCLPTAQMFANHKLLVFTENQPALNLITTLIPDETGNFSTNLPPGKYLIKLEQNPSGPESVKGLPLTVNISKGMVNTISVDIDTGIR